MTHTQKTISRSTSVPDNNMARTMADNNQCRHCVLRLLVCTKQIMDFLLSMSDREPTKDGSGGCIKTIVLPLVPRSACGWPRRQLNYDVCVNRLRLVMAERMQYCKFKIFLFVDAKQIDLTDLAPYCCL